jgi:hypothetical protein
VSLFTEYRLPAAVTIVPNFGFCLIVAAYVALMAELDYAVYQLTKLFF